MVYGRSLLSSREILTESSLIQRIFSKQQSCRYLTGRGLRRTYTSGLAVGRSRARRDIEAVLSSRMSVLPLWSNYHPPLRSQVRVFSSSSIRAKEEPPEKDDPVPVEEVKPGEKDVENAEDEVVPVK